MTVNPMVRTEIGKYMNINEYGLVSELMNPLELWDPQEVEAEECEFRVVC